MNDAFMTLDAAFESLAVTVEKVTAENRSSFEANGNSWNIAAVDRFMLANSARIVRKQIKARDPGEPSDNDSYVMAIAARVALVQAHTVPHLFNGNATQAIPAYLAFTSCVREFIEEAYPLTLTVPTNEMPHQVARRSQRMKAQLDAVEIDHEKIVKQLAEIEAAHEAAESLPTDLEALEEARKLIVKAKESADVSERAAAESMRTALHYTTSMEANAEEAESLIEKCHTAYHVTTTHGLAAAFHERAQKLSQSMWVWVAGLLVALTATAVIGWYRVMVLSSALNTGDPRWGSVALHLLLAFVSVAAPLWFAWVATKQVGQRFRLAEDYGFKASVAKAYQGYKNEASKLNPDANFESRLFDIALSRLEEPPLRLVEAETHGSPYHEILNSLAFKTAVENIPGFAKDALAHAKAAIQKLPLRSTGELPPTEVTK